MLVYQAGYLNHIFDQLNPLKIPLTATHVSSLWTKRLRHVKGPTAQSLCFWSLNIRHEKKWWVPQFFKALSNGYMVNIVNIWLIYAVSIMGMVACCQVPFWLLNVQFLMCQTLGFASPKRNKHNTYGMDSAFPIGKAQNHWLNKPITIVLPGSIPMMMLLMVAKSIRSYPAWCRISQPSTRITMTRRLSGLVSSWISIIFPLSTIKKTTILPIVNQN